MLLVGEKNNSRGERIRKMGKYISAGLILVLLLCFMVFPVFAGNSGRGIGNHKSPYDRLISVEKWRVSLHLVYDYKRSDGFEHAVSDWSGILDIQVSDICQWYNKGGLDVTVDGVNEIDAGKCHITIVAKGNEKYGFDLKVRKDGYVISQGYCNTQSGTSTRRCPNEVKTERGSITYSQPWKIKVPLPEHGTTLSGNATFTHDKPSAADRPLSKGESIQVRWELTPVREREVKYRETALDVAAMVYDGTAVDPHIFVMDNWLPHANFAGEVWVDGVNKVKIRTEPAPTGSKGKRQNVTSEYKIFRLARSWDIIGGAKELSTKGWRGDNKDPIQDWIDNPGLALMGPPPTWNKRVMVEFLVQVMEHPEIGRVYAAFAMETRKNAYRIRYIDSEFLTEEEYKQAKASPGPFRPYPFTDKDEGWVELVQDPQTKEWKPLKPTR